MASVLLNEIKGIENRYGVIKGNEQSLISILLLFDTFLTSIHSQKNYCLTQAIHSKTRQVITLFCPVLKFSFIS